MNYLKNLFCIKPCCLSWGNFRTMEKRLFGLIGFPLIHSYSEKYFNDKFKDRNIKNVEYKSFAIPDIKLVNEIINDNPNLCGLNVTFPFKESILKYVDEIERDAQLIGASNIIKIVRKDKKIKLVAYNSDVYGFRKSISPLLKPYHKKALIIGKGGAAKAAKFVLAQLGIGASFVSRNPFISNQISYSQIDRFVLDEHKILINASPIGMFPQTNELPDIPYNLLTKEHLVFDMIYNPAETRFLKKAKEQGATTINGLSMFHNQADRSWEIWNKIRT